jgi:AraC-like DNA-binding protein
MNRSARASAAPPAEEAHLVWLPVLGGLQSLNAHYVNHYFAPHTHDTFAIGVFERGAARVRCEATPITVGVDDVLAINPGAVHSAGPASAEGWEYRAIYPSLELVDAVMEESGHRGPRYFAHPRIADRALASDVRRLMTELSRHRTPLALETLAVGVIHRLWSHASRDERRPAAPPRRASAGLERARECMDAAPSEAPTLAQLAAEAHMSRYHFIRAFTERYGLTPYAYFLERRVERARRLLDRGERPVDVAMRCGFADQSHMIRHFKRIVGVTPGEYMKCGRQPSAVGPAPRAHQLTADG